MHRQAVRPGSDGSSVMLQTTTTSSYILWSLLFIGAFLELLDFNLYNLNCNKCIFLSPGPATVTHFLQVLRLACFIVLLSLANSALFKFFNLYCRFNCDICFHLTSTRWLDFNWICPSVSSSSATSQVFCASYWFRPLNCLDFSFHCGTFKELHFGSLHVRLTLYIYTLNCVCPEAQLVVYYFESSAVNHLFQVFLF